MKPAQNCTGFIFCAFSATVHRFTATVHHFTKSKWNRQIIIATTSFIGLYILIYAPREN